MSSTIAISLFCVIFLLNLTSLTINIFYTTTGSGTMKECDATAMPEKKFRIILKGKEMQFCFRRKLQCITIYVSLRGKRNGSLD